MDTDGDLENHLDILIPKDVMKKINTKVFKELLMSIVVFIYYIFTYIVFLKTRSNVFTYCLNICACTFTIIAIVLFEVGYRKENDIVFIRGIEIMFISLISLFMPYVYLKRGKTFISLYSLSCLYISIYYAIKALVVYINEVKKYRRGLSDIKEILTFKRESYLEIKNERKFENVDDDNSIKKRKTNILKNQLNKIKSIKRKEIKKVLPTEKLEENQEQEDTIELKTNVSKKETKTKTPKKRGRKPTGKKVVKSMATARKKKKEDEE